MSCDRCQQSFGHSPKEQALCDRFGVSLSPLCRSCRLRDVMAARNEWKLYRRKCDKTGADIISAYPPDSPFTVYSNKEWWGDGWSALDYGRDFDFSRPFFEQYAALQKAVPREGTSVMNSENCDYNSHIRDSRNCYLNSLIARCEDTYYSYWMVDDKDVYDSLYTNASALCYGCISANNGYHSFVIEESHDCRDCYFSFQLRGCDHCIFSSNLATKSYYAFNKKVTEEEFEALKTQYCNGSYAAWQEGWRHFMKMRSEAVQRFAHNLNCENLSGDHCYNCRNSEDIYESFDSEECVNAVSMAGSSHIQNTYSAGWQPCEGVYYSSVMRGCKLCAFCTYTWHSGSLWYCDSCVSCDSCFGCIGLKHQKFCILNKQYSEPEYRALLPKIIAHMKSTGEWGRFFPPSVFPYAYNESAAMDFFPLEKTAALAWGYQWFDYEAPLPKVDKIIPAGKLPDNIADTPDDVLNWAIQCEATGRPFKIIPQELTFYRENGLPLPRRHPEQRHKDRMRLRNPLRLFERECDRCAAAIQSSYGTERKETVYCEACYLKTVE